MRFAILALLVFPLFLTACGAAPEKPSKPIERGLSAGAIIVGPTAEGHVYAHYEEAADRFPPPRLLFFGGNDAFSKATDELLQSLYSGTGVNASTFHFDFGTSKGARLTYKVLVPDSIVLVTASGAQPALIHPSAETVRSLVHSSP